jgi:hypothetical protein
LRYLTEKNISLPKRTMRRTLNAIAAADRDAVVWWAASLKCTADVVSRVSAIMHLKSRSESSVERHFFQSFKIL